MVRIVIKGGVWKNTEDEILKAAVMKYGKNQWARISSLLVRKSPKQCKARWYEWLDPSIKKTEWTREEEEKLLHLAKIMPTQWRTIAPIIGRTASQCLEHYEKLLDSAQEKDGTYDPTNDPRRLKPGEIDPNPEGKPARPDPVDMDEDEKEMLSEARARLANTKGKKAKRKAREKQLEEARRLASLQKRRELRAAGIEIRKHRKKRKWGIDYNEEIPFQRVAPPGFFDTTAEIKETLKLAHDPSFLHMDIRQLDGLRRDEIEDRERKKDRRRLNLQKKTALPETLALINKINDPEYIRKRSRLLLPAPQVSDKELEDIAKIGTAALEHTGTTGGPTATQTLLASYGTPAVTYTPQRTPRTPIAKDPIALESQNLLALREADTPLKGGENTPIHPTDFSGATPKRKAIQTPNITAASASGATPGATPGRIMQGQTPRPMLTGKGSETGGKTPQTPKTPVRDELGLNPGIGENSESTGMTAEEAVAAGSARAEKRRQIALKKKLRSGLAQLPTAQNEYQLVMPDLPPEPEEPIEVGPKMEEDAEDTLSRIKAEEKAKESAALKRRSLAIQKSLPRPLSINFKMDGGKGDDIEEEVGKELLALLKHDQAKYPLPGTAKKNKKKPKIPSIEHFSDMELQKARELVFLETEEAEKERKQLEKEGKEITSSSDILITAPSELLSSTWEASATDFAFLPSSRAYGTLSTASEEERLTAIQQEFQLIKDQFTKEAQRAQKIHNFTQIMLAGYEERSGRLMDTVAALSTQLDESQSDFNCFEMLAKKEAVAIPNRVNELQAQVELQKTKEKDLQERYRDLLQSKEQLLMGEAMA